MGIIDQFRKNKTERKEHTTPPPEGHTLAEILKDKKRSHIFGKLLEKEGLDKLATRVAQGELQAGDIELLEEQRLKFSEIIIKSEQIGNWLNDKEKDEKGKPIPGTENIIKFAEKYEDFGKILNLVGPEKAVRVIRGQLEEIAVTDERQFKDIIIAMETLESYKNGEYKKVNDEVEKMCQDGKFTPKEYLDALAIKDPNKKTMALEELAQRSMGGFKKLVSRLSPMSSLGRWANRGTGKLEEAEVLMESSVTELETIQGQIGAVLFCSMNVNEDMRKALSRELVGEKTEVKQESGFDGAKQETGTFDEAKCDADWEIYKEQEAYGATIDDFERNTIRDRFIDEQKKKQREKTGSKGFWHSIFSTLFEKKIDDKKKTLK